MKLPVPPLPPGRPRLVVTGFMATGKTSAGSAAAQRLSLPFFDLDEVVERRAGMPVARIFERAGEAAFRELEDGAVRDAARLSGAVVATGGGAVLGHGWTGLATGSEVAVLQADRAELLRRLDGDGDHGRPLVGDDAETRVDALLRTRATAYAAAGRPLDTTQRSVDDVAAELALRYPARQSDPVRIQVRTPGGERPFVVGSLDRLGEELGDALPGTRAAVVVCDVALLDVATRAAESLRSAGLSVPIPLPIASGEAAKDAATVSELWSSFAAAGLDRASPVVAVGGGATLDVAGFAAATFARGLPLVNVPTTVLAMVDASVGGKVAVDHAGVKNLAGAFHHPHLVLADPSTLRTLPERAYRAGLAEAVKAFLLASPLALDALPDLALDDPGSPGLIWAVEQAVRIKAAYVAEDPEDRGVRHALNLGHTFGHALESASGFDLSHGEAVAIGLVAAARLGATRDPSAAGLPDRLSATLLALGLPVAPPPGLAPDALVRAMGADKKRAGGRLRFVVPAEDGAELVDDVSPDAALAALFDRSPQPKEA